MIDYTLPLDQLPDPLPIEPLTKPFDVTITPPGSKSITCRAYVLAALADGESKIIRPLRADDTDKLLDALCTLGAEARWDGEDVYIKGVNGCFPRGGEVNLGDGGAPTRFMIACACLAAEPVVVDGSKRMRERPIAEGVDMLRKLGAKIEYVQEEGKLPVRVVPSGGLNGGDYVFPRTKSSQTISALMLVAPYMSRTLQYRFAGSLTSAAYYNLTWSVLAQWGVTVIAPDEGDDDIQSDHSIEPHSIAAMEFCVEPDASSAVYWLSAAVLSPGSRVDVPGICTSSFQPDARFGVTLAWMFTDTRWQFDTPDHIRIAGPPRLRGIKGYHGSMVSMPDASLSLCAVASQAVSSSEITGLETLREKESDRIAALAAELRKIGCRVDATDTSLRINPSSRHDEPVVIETYNDHRMAMSFAVLGLARPGISIKDPACVSKSYPTFWQDFAKLYQ